MKHSKIDSLQPLLSDVRRFKRFMGSYFLKSVEALTSDMGHKYWELTIADASGDVTVICNNPQLMVAGIEVNKPIHVEAQCLRIGNDCYFKAKNIVLVSSNGSIGADFSFLPRSLCPDPKAFDGLFFLLSKMQTRVLKDFLRKVILQEHIVVNFLRCPASINFHHKYPGGLLKHSVQIAWDVQGVQAFNQVDRDTAIVAALLHDIGKTITMTPEMKRTPLGGLVDHAQLTLEICANALSELDKQAPGIGYQLRHAWTCYSPNSRYGNKPKTLIAKTLQRADGSVLNDQVERWSLPECDGMSNYVKQSAN